MRKLKDATVKLLTHMTQLFSEGNSFYRTPASHTWTQTSSDQASVIKPIIHARRVQRSRYNYRHDSEMLGNNRYSKAWCRVQVMLLCEDQWDTKHRTEFSGIILNKKYLKLFNNLSHLSHFHTAHTFTKNKYIWSISLMNSRKSIQIMCVILKASQKPKTRNNRNPYSEGEMEASCCVHNSLKGDAQISLAQVSMDGNGNG